jgi:1-deoxyxylulose-5-phosphate synthase
MIPLCLDQGVGLIPWSPIARGRLARPVGTATARGASDQYQQLLYARTESADGAVIDAVAAVAADLGRTMAQVALAWVRQKPGVAAPIIGYSRPEQFSDILAGLDLVLGSDHLTQLEAAYVPHAIAGH